MEPDLFEEAVRLSRKAFAEERYNMSYHILAAALHCAKEERNIEGLNLVERLARESLQWIDENAPDYEHSTRSTVWRNGHNIFLSLTQQASREVTAVRADARITDLKARLAASPDQENTGP